MAVRRVSEGRTIKYTPSAAKSAGDVVVQGDLVGVVVHDLEANKLGNLDIEGVFEFPKATGEGTAITAGATLFWDAGNSRASLSASAGKKLGVAVLPAANGDDVVHAKLTPSDPGKPAAAVAALAVTVGGTFNQAQVQGIADKVDAVIAALKAAGLMASA